MGSLVDETIKLLKESYKLEEFAKDKDSISRDLYNDSKQVVEHIIKCMLWPKSRDLSHWKTEIMGSLFSIPKYKNNNKYPTFTQLNNWFLKGKLEDTANSLNTNIRIVCRKENKKVPDYNLQNIYKCIADYLTWLCQELSKTGVVDDVDMENKLNELFLLYK